MRLTKPQIAILQRLCGRDLDRDGAESGAEMARAMWGKNCFSSFEHGQRGAAQLVHKGLAKKLGFTETNAQCYGPTQAGRDALAKHASEWWSK